LLIKDVIDFRNVRKVMSFRLSVYLSVRPSISRNVSALFPFGGSP